MVRKEYSAGGVKHGVPDTGAYKLAHKYRTRSLPNPRLRLDGQSETVWNLYPL